MDKDLLLVAKDDVMGRKMQDLNLTVRKSIAKVEFSCGHKRKNYFQCVLRVEMGLTL